MAVDSGDTAWMLTATALVLFMTLPGLALFYGGLVRVSSVLSIFMQCFCITCVVSLLWLICGYSLAFTDGGEYNGFIGSLDSAFLMNVHLETESGTIPETVFFMFQMTFAIIAPALIVGAYPERTRFYPCIIFSAVWMMVVYVPVCHWIWGGGWLAALGVMDFAGGIVIHCTAGVSGLVFAWYLGPRNGFPSKVRPPHNPVLTSAGAAMLWVGWFGFNAGSACAAGKEAGMAMVCTHIAAAAAAMSWTLLESRVTNSKPNSVGTVTGMVAGLAAVTPASGYIGPEGALVLGIISGVVCEQMAHVVKDVMLIDDSLDVFAVHGVGGIIGSIGVAVLGHPYFQGLGLASTIGYHLGVQILAVSAVCMWSFVATWMILKGLDMITHIRATDEEEKSGLDVVEHGELAYGLNPEKIESSADLSS